MAFGVGSITKTFVAVVVLQLVEEGSLDLDDPVRRWLPAFPNVDGQITVRQLLSHRTGLFDLAESRRRLDTMLADPHRIWSPEESLHTFVLAPYDRPGRGFRYSSTNYFLLGMIVEKITGSTLGRAIRQRILEPLGLTRTFLAGEEAVREPVAHMWYDLDRDGTEEDLGEFSQDAKALWSMEWAAGALFSSADDLARFSYALFDGDLLDKTSRSQMVDFESLGPENTYGLGVLVISGVLPGIRGIGHDGLVGGFSARMVYAADPGIHIAVLLNQDSFRCKAAISSALAQVVVRNR